MEERLEHTDHDDARLPGLVKWVFAGFALVAAFFLLVEHRAHVLPLAPWLLLLACPLMHVLMHGKHGNRGGHGKHGGPP